MATDIRAFIFDMNGTMIDDMDYHIRAWYQILNQLGAGLSYERVREECYGKNDELLERIFPRRFSADDKHRMSLEKETAYQQAFRPHLRLLPGLQSLLKSASQKRIPMAIGSAAIMYNIDFVIDGLSIRPFFDALVSADDVARSKPDPETFITCATRMGVAPEHCLVFEDSPKGVEAAAAAGMEAVVITTMHRPAEFEACHNIRAFIPDFTCFDLQNLAN